MNKSDESNLPLANLIRIVFVSQSVAYLWRGVAIAIDDAPDIFQRVSVWSFILPIIVLSLLFILKFDRWFAKLNAEFLIIFLSLVVSISTTVIAIMELIYHFDVPEYLLTPTRQYWQTISIITLIFYVFAFFLTLYFSIRVIQKQSRIIEAK